MLYKEGEAMRKITDRSRVQQKLWDVFQLEHIESPDHSKTVAR